MANNYTFTTNGVIIPDTAEIKEAVQNEYTTAFQDLGELSLEDSTPQGRLIDVETNARVSTLTFNAEVANALVNISLSGGVILDCWGANFDIPRNSQTYSSTPVAVTGIANTVIPQNAEGIDDNGIIWKNENEIIIGADGTATGTFICSIAGAVELSTGQLNKIVASGGLGIDGWETLINTANAVTGTEEEADTPYKIRFLQSLFNGSALFGNYASAAYKVDGVRDVLVVENPNDYTLDLDGLTLAKHSVYCCIDGGDEEDVAYSLYSVKSGGCGWNGNTTVTVEDKTYGTKNTVKYQIPTNANIALEINVIDNFNSNANLTVEIKTVINNYFSNVYLDTGYSKVGIRAVLEPFVIASLLQSQISGISVSDVSVGLVTPANRAVAKIVKASVTSGIEWVSVNASTFATEVGSINGRYNFKYDGSNWKHNGSTVTLTDFGISVTGTPVLNDEISVLYSNGSLSNSPLPLYATEKPVISDSNITVNINE